MFTQITPAVKRLLVLNAGALLLANLVFPHMDQYFALHYVGSTHFLPTQFFTYMFMHGGLWHLFSNMIGLMVFGNLLERFWGSRRFLVFYMLTGIGAGVIYSGVQYYKMSEMKAEIEAYSSNPTPQAFNAFLLEHYPQMRRELMSNGYMDSYEQTPTDPLFTQQIEGIMKRIYEQRANIPMVGASGAIFGILMAFGLLFPNTELLLLFPPMPIKAKYLVIFYGAYEIYAELSARGENNVAHLAHLGGLLVGFIIVKYWQKNSKHFY